MTIFRRLLACLMALAILCALACPVFAEEDQQVQDILQQMLNYYYHYQTAGETDVYRLLEQMRQIDAEKADLWQKIFEYWFYATDDLPKNETVAPDGLPQDDSLCIVVLGYQLASTGAMLPELKGRLELALQAAGKYPNAYILCSGGGTAADAPNSTEAGQMAYWLDKQGISSDRVIIESDSPHTIQNARFSLQILSEEYPQVRQLIIVSSDYHLTRSSTLFYAEALHTAAKAGTEPITIAACLGYEAGHEGIAEDPLDQTAHLARLSGFEFEKAEAPALSRLTDLTVSGEVFLEPGEALQLEVTAHYDSGFSRDVTSDCIISGYDPQSPKTQLLSVTYSENEVQITATVQVLRPVKETTAPTEAPENIPAEEPQPEPSGRDFPFLWVPGALAAASAAIILLKKKKA